MHRFARPTAIGLAGFCSFLNLYAPQPLLPMIRDRFGADAVSAGHMISATTLAVALIAPFTGVVADHLGRKRVIATAMFALIVPTLMVAFSDSLGAMVFWRFVQGLLLPPIFVVTVAYIGDELPMDQATTMAGIYTSACCFGGFFGRFMSGLLAAQFGLRGAFIGLAVLSLIAAIGFTALLPRETRFVPSGGILPSLRHMRDHLLNPRLTAIFAIGFGVLFSFVGTFNYIAFYLAGPPFGLSAAAIGTIFVVWLIGVVTTPATGFFVRRIGRRALVLIGMVFWAAGLLVTLSSNLALIVAGLALAAGCGFFCQAASTAYVAVSAERARSSAVGLYVTFYYLGGSVGAVLPGYAWNRFGWPGCVAVLVAMVGIMGVMVARFWRESHRLSGKPGVAA